MKKQNFSHILQKTGVLKNFTIAKVVPSVKIEKIKEAALKKAKTEDEFNSIMIQAMKKIGDMHNQNNPIPGIIYERTHKDDKIENLSKEHIRFLKSKNFTKNELCRYLLMIIHSLKLGHKDFEDANSDGNLNEGNYNEDDEGDEFEPQ
jgi:hypothetical protein